MKNRQKWLFGKSVKNHIFDPKIFGPPSRFFFDFFLQNFTDRSSTDRRTQFWPNWHGGWRVCAVSNAWWRRTIVKKRRKFRWFSKNAAGRRKIFWGLFSEFGSIEIVLSSRFWVDWRRNFWNPPSRSRDPDLRSLGSTLPIFRNFGFCRSRT